MRKSPSYPPQDAQGARFAGSSAISVRIRQRRGAPNLVGDCKKALDRAAGEVAASRDLLTTALPRPLLDCLGRGA